MLKLIMLIYLSLLFAACIDGDIIKDDRDDSEIIEAVAKGVISGCAYYTSDSSDDDNSDITVTLKKNGIMNSWTETTDASGLYQFNDLPDGGYELSAEGPDGIKSIKSVSATLSRGTLTVPAVDYLYLKMIPTITYSRNGGKSTPPKPQKAGDNGEVIIEQGTGLSRNGDPL